MVRNVHSYIEQNLKTLERIKNGTEKKKAAGYGSRTYKRKHPENRFTPKCSVEELGKILGEKDDCPFGLNEKY